VTLYHNNNPKLATTITGIDVTGTATMDGLTVDGTVLATRAEFGGMETSADRPLMVKTDTDNFALHIEENSGAESWQIGVDADGDLGFHNSATASASVTFNDSGNVGIGTASPSSKLEIYSSLVTDAYLTQTNGTTAQTLELGNAYSLYTGGSGSDSAIASNNTLAFATNNSERMRIDSSGNVGIGTSSPTDKLNISSGTNQIGLDTGNQATYGTLDIGHFTNGAFIGTQAGSNAASNILRFGTSGSERVRIDSSGKVGIGTSSPTDKVTVNGAVVATSAGSSFSSGASRALLDWNTGASQARVGAINGTGTANSLGFYVGTTEKMRIDSSGNVGIGTSSPSANLEITQSGNNVGLLVAGGGYNYTAKFESSDAEANIIIEDSNSANNGNMIGVATNDMYFITNTAERMRINSSGNMILNNTANLDASHIAIWQSTGKNGITFRAPNTSPYMAMQFQNSSGGRIGYIQYTNTGTSFSTTSDYRLKENVEYDWDATTRLKQLKPSRFNFIADPDTTVDGFLAHEVQNIVPEAITGVRDEMQEEEYEVTPAVLDEDGNVVTEAVMGTREVPKYQGIDQSKLVPLLTKALQEQQTIIESLEARITALES
jgi:hypothetical protein